MENVSCYWLLHQTNPTFLVDEFVVFISFELEHIVYLYFGFILCCFIICSLISL